MKTKKRCMAVFDIDGTVFRSSLTIELMDNLIAAGVIPARAKDLYEKHHQSWLNRHGSYEKYITAVVAVFWKYLKGLHEEDFAKVARRTSLAHRHRVYRYTKNLIKQLKKANYYLVAISHSPKYVVDGFAKQLGFDKVYGMLLELEDGTFTGKALYGDIIKNKALILKRVLEKEAVTLKGSIGVGDTESDISFLELVENPICFNPNKNLYDCAKKKKWKVVVERKDVIYNVQ